MVILRGALCVAGIPEKKQKKIIRALKMQRPVRTIYLITAPKNQNNLLDILKGDQLKSRENRKRIIPVFGVAGSEESASELAACMVCGAYATTGQLKVVDFLERRARQRSGDSG